MHGNLVGAAFLTPYGVPRHSDGSRGTHFVVPLNCDSGGVGSDDFSAHDLSHDHMIANERRATAVGAQSGDTRGVTPVVSLGVYTIFR